MHEQVTPTGFCGGMFDILCYEQVAPTALIRVGSSKKQRINSTV